MLIEQIILEVNPDVEVISFSTYLGDTRIIDAEQPHKVLDRVKSKLYVGSNHAHSNLIERIKTCFEQLKIQLTVMDTITS